MRVASLFPESSAAGQRVLPGGLGPLEDLVCPEGKVGRIAARSLGPAARPVRAVLFDKSPQANWGLGWHQDRTIAVRERRECAGFERWSSKSGQVHVEPPAGLSAAMVTLRVHVDAVGHDNAPLLIIAGSHRLGRLTEPAIEVLVRSSVPSSCLADPGDVWAYRTPVVHASAPQSLPGRRRVLQIDYAAQDLPGGLQWVDLLSQAIGTHSEALTAANSSTSTRRRTSAHLSPSTNTSGVKGRLL